MDNPDKIQVGQQINLPVLG
ncbi:MAG TPA: hypothetical protein VGU67_12505 [Edaphobacter sp.]|nr:hypothetical protein [Edaphobacter sp.]